MRRALPILTFVLTVALVALLGGCAQSDNTTTPSTQPTTTEPVSPGIEPTMQATPGGPNVDISGFQFNPATVEITAGESVTWTNSDSAPHTVTGDGGLDSPTMEQGQTYTHEFPDAGEYSYSCGIHPQMTGTVVVK